jgi:type I restriction-modification system DNA methylase subunit
MTTGKGLGQFFTQPLVKKIMVKLIKPVLHKNGKIDTCCDPTMGTGGFLITYLQEILKQAKQKNIKPDWEFIKNEGLYGKEIEPDTYQLAVSNMLISSGHMFDKLERGDSIREPIKRKFDNILANPPFGLKGFEYANFNASLKQEYLPIKSNGTVPLFIQAIISMLKVGGKCAVVIPYGSDVSSKTKKDIIAVREYLFKTCDLKEVVLLPIDIFTYTKTRTCIFYFIKKREVKDGLVNKGYETKSVSFYEYDASEDNKKLVINVPIEVIAENSFSLNHEEYLPDKVESYNDDIELKTLGEMCKFFPKSKRKAGDGKKEGEYAFFSSSQEKKLFCDVPDYKEECIIVGTGGTANIKYSKMFSCSSDNFILKSNTKECLTKYIYYYLLNNINVLQKGFAGSGIQHISKDYINNIQIPVPPIERQQEIIETCEYNEDLIKKMEEEIKQAKIQARLRVSEILNNL